MTALVSIGIPVYKRLNFLPEILKIVCSQDYPHIELIVSDNGMNGPKVPEIVDQYYSRPYKFRQNPCTVSISTHYNQLVNEASGKYFVLLCDDDEISSNYVSELVTQLEHYPSAAAAIASQAIMDESGVTIRRSERRLPSIASGTDFIKAAWHTHEYRFECFVTIMARTENIKANGGYPDFTTGTHNDDALLIKLCLTGDVVFSEKCCFHWRMYESSHGWAIGITDLAKASKEFLQFLDGDATILEFARHNPDCWAKMKNYLVELSWRTYYWRWTGMYRRRLSNLEWFYAAFAMPFIPSYYRRVAVTLLREAGAVALGPVKRRFPGAYRKYRQARYGKIDAYEYGDGQH